jgi:competence protein ComEA
MDHGGGQTPLAGGLSLGCRSGGTKAYHMTKLFAAALASALASLAGLAAANTQPTVNVNTAQQSELQSVPGLDRNSARTIIQYRNRNGPYHSLDDLAQALGEPTTSKIATQVAFDGPPYIGPDKPAKKKKK